MGVVLHGRDNDLNRDLAVKVLLERHRDNPDVLRRFFEEAQIGGQLQHPGIVPVYDLGTFPDKRPFFAMKFVKGETLSALLKKRANPAEDLSRFLSIFEQVAQTIAYAHSRGVIHRDLKPANIMVGSFGEVQVMDWGLAKVLVSEDGTATDLSLMQIHSVKLVTDVAESVAGSVLGTPAYMSPEQARGEVDLVDERADVFGLGSILCAILTGEPAYVGATMAEVLRKAGIADQKDTYTRLDACGADPELIAIAKQAMAAEPSDRPRDAGEVARRITTHVAGVQEKLRSTELAWVEATTRAESERARHKLVLALSAAILVSVLVGGGSWIGFRMQRDALITEADRLVGTALAKAEAFEAEAQRMGELDAEAWEIAFAAASQAKDRASSQTVRPVMASRVAAVYEATLKGAERARELVRRRKADRKLADALDSARLEGAIDRDHGARTEATRRGYYKALRESGLNYTSQPDSEVVKLIASGDEHERIAAALDDCARIETIPSRKSQMSAIAKAIDPDPFRNRVRKALAEGDRAELVRLASLPEVSTLPSQSVRLLATSLSDRGETERATAILEEAQRRFPADFWLNFDLGKTLQDTSPSEAVRYLTAAVTARPNSAGARVAMGTALDIHGSPEKAEIAYRDAMKLSPDSAGVHENMGIVLDRQKKFGPGLAAYRKAVKLNPESARAHRNLASALQKMSEFAESASEYREVLKLEPADARTWANLGLVLKRQGRSNDAIDAYHRSIAIDPNLATAHLHLGFVLRETGNLTESAKELREATRLDPRDPVALSNLGLTLSTMGKHGEAITACRDALALNPNLAGSHYRLGLAYGNAGNLEDSITSYREALRLDPTYPEAHCNLGLRLMAKGALPEALAELRKGDDLGSKVPEWRYPSKRWIADCERLMDLSQRLPLILKGEEQPKDETQAIMLASHCESKKLYASASRFLGDALAANPRLADDRKSQHRYRAASFAILAGTGQGDDDPKPDDAAKEIMRAKALEWMREELDANLKLQEGPNYLNRALVAKTFERWRTDPNLAGVRDGEWLSKLPEAERANWQIFWKSVK